VIFVSKSNKKPLCVGDFEKVFGHIPTDTWDDDKAILVHMCSTLKSHNPNMTKSEEMFLELYFGTLQTLVAYAHDQKFEAFTDANKQIGFPPLRLPTYKSTNDVWRALLPIP
jgi:hypothetical protein